VKPRDDLAAARGCLLAVAFSAPFWVLLFWWLLR
jgi:hypothetical protein